MTTLASKPSSLVPTLPDAADKRLRHCVTALRGSDQLHFTAKALGFPKGSVQAIYGYCVLFDENGAPYAVTAYVRPLCMHHAVAFADREAVRYRFDNQKEQWFGSVLLYLVPVDLTDYADCLRLERQPEELVQLLYPEVAYSYAQAA